MYICGLIQTSIIMKKLIFNFGIVGIMLLFCAACGNSEKTGTTTDSTNQLSESTRVEAVAEEEPEVDPNAPLTAEDEEEVLKILKQIHMAQLSRDMDPTPYFSKRLIKRIKDAPKSHGGMEMGVCCYGGGTEIPSINPESIKITKFDPATGKVSYKLVVNYVDEIDGSEFVVYPKETATFIREDGKIVLDQTSAENLFS